MQTLIIIDVQNDFITGSLGTKEAQQMLPRLIQKAKDYDGEIIMTQDTHCDDYMNTQEGRMLPIPHCIAETDGWNFPDQLNAIREEKQAAVYRKNCFGSTQMVEDLKRKYEAGNLESVELAGICTDVCVISNALMIKAALPELPVVVDASCCTGVTVKKHEAALEVMESCQIKVRR